MNYFLYATHVASILTLAAYLVRDILWLRILSIVASFAGIIFNYYVPVTPLWAVIYWNLVFIAINAVQIVIIIKERSGVHFTKEEREIYETMFQKLRTFRVHEAVAAGQMVRSQRRAGPHH